MWRPSSVCMPPGCTAAARTPRSRCRWSKATAKRMFAVFERPYATRGLIRTPLKVGILKVHVRAAVTRRRHVDQASFRPNERRRNPVDQDKVAQVICAELCFEAVCRVPEGCWHHAGIGNDYIERFPFRQQLIRAGTHALEVGQIELN